MVEWSPRRAMHEKINYIEFPSRDMTVTKQFFSAVFDWQFTDYGEQYIAFHAAQAGIDGGFYLAPLSPATANGSALAVFYSHGLEATQAKIEANGGSLVKPIFSFPGGRRFHFADPNGNEYAVWSDRGTAS